MTLIENSHNLCKEMTMKPLCPKCGYDDARIFVSKNHKSWVTYVCPKCAKLWEDRVGVESVDFPLEVEKGP